MKSSKTELYAHLVWATYNRVEYLNEAIERDVHRCISAAAIKEGCIALALNGTLDHVHLVVRFPAKLSISRLTQLVKGPSSLMLNGLLGPEQTFRWQEGYGGFTLSRAHIELAQHYVARQKQHHAQGTAWAAWEETFTEED